MSLKTLKTFTFLTCTILLGLLAFNTSAQKFIPHFYISLEYLHANMNRNQDIVHSFSERSLEDGDQPNDFPPTSLVSINNTGGNDDVVYNVSPTLGYSVMRYLDLELSYNNFKDSSQTLTTTSKFSGDPQQNYIFTNSANITAKAYNFMIDLHYPVFQNIIAHIKLGASYFHQVLKINSAGEFTFTGDSSLDENLWSTAYSKDEYFTIPLIGASMQFYLPTVKNLSVLINWSHYFGVTDDYEFANPTKTGSVPNLSPRNIKIKVKQLPSFDTFGVGLRYDF